MTAHFDRNFLLPTSFKSSCFGHLSQISTTKPHISPLISPFRHSKILGLWSFLVLSSTLNTRVSLLFSLSPYIHHCKTPFHHCTFSFITAHFVYHCTLKHALVLKQGELMLKDGGPIWPQKFIHSFTHSFIHSAISIAPLQVLYYSEALPTTARILYRSFTPKRICNCR